MRVVITNVVALNGGDAAILEAVMKLLRAAFGGQTQFVIFDSQPAVAGRYYPDLVFRELWHTRATRRAGRLLRKPRRAFHLGRFRLAAALRKRGLRTLASLVLDAEERLALEDYAAADLVVSTGGTYLVEHYSLKPRLFEFELARVLAKPLVLFTQSLGPFSKPENARTVGAALRGAAGVMVRDAASRQHLLELQVPAEKIRLTADAAFALEPGKVRGGASAGPRRAVISVREWAYFKNGDRAAGMKQFTEAIAALTIRLVEHHGVEVTFLSTCQGVPEYRYDDSKIAAEIVGSLPEGIRARVTVNRDFHRPQELLVLLGTFDFAVSTRMHLAILALLAGTPVLAVAYEFKTTELFTRLNMGAWVREIEAVGGNELVALANAFLKELPSMRDSLRSAVAAEQAEAVASVEWIKSIMETR
jgi:colanic acid/amylovoran biosynthesis protein